TGSLGPTAEQSALLREQAARQRVAGGEVRVDAGLRDRGGPGDPADGQGVLVVELGEEPARRREDLGAQPLALTPPVAGAGRRGGPVAHGAILPVGEPAWGDLPPVAEQLYGKLPNIR